MCVCVCVSAAPACSWFIHDPPKPRKAKEATGPPDPTRPARVGAAPHFRWRSLRNRNRKEEPESGSKGFSRVFSLRGKGTTPWWLARCRRQIPDPACWAGVIEALLLCRNRILGFAVQERRCPRGVGLASSASASPGPGSGTKASGARCLLQDLQGVTEPTERSARSAWRSGNQ